MVKTLTDLTKSVDQHAHAGQIQPQAKRNLGTEFEKTRLSDIWSEFEDSLVEREFDEAIKEKRFYVYKTIEASEYFNEDRVISQSLMTRYWRGLPSILVELGILGTFCGLYIGLIGLTLPDSSVSPVETAQKIQDGISALLSGVSTAFITSIFGMFCSIVFSVFEKLVF